MFDVDYLLVFYLFVCLLFHKDIVNHFLVTYIYVQTGVQSHAPSITIELLHYDIRI